ncbi:MAG: hypothetical protein N2C12_01260, partial [Planctomycetales bacterium]
MRNVLSMHKSAAMVLMVFCTTYFLLTVAGCQVERTDKDTDTKNGADKAVDKKDSEGKGDGENAGKDGDSKKLRIAFVT